ncbi:MAG: cell division protein FtsZ [Helicobacteraceae bacterium]|jgi:cell division protein FtsZ|nr:cell division protein FtsZ [Helicobacteraceae bacterium]
MSKSSVNNLFTVEESERPNIVNIKVIGVGGGGANMVNYMIREGQKGIDMIVANTDYQHLATSLASTKIQLGEKRTSGLGSGGQPEVGKQAAEESYDQVKEALKGADLVFIAVGLGGGTGTGACPVVAQAAKENGSLTIGVCTLPFSFEGPKRSKLAKNGLESLRGECDSMIVVPNEKLFSIVDKSMSYAESFAMVDAVLARAVRGISSVVLPSGMDGINTDFNDLKTVMGHRGKALMGMGHSLEGNDSAYDALKDAIESPLLDNLSINGAMGVLAHFQFNPVYPLVAINRAMQVVHDAVGDDSDVIFGTSLDASLKPEEVRVTIIATGFSSGEPDVEMNSSKSARVSESKPSGGTMTYDPQKGGFVFSDGRMVDMDEPSIIRKREAQHRKAVGDFDDDLSSPTYRRRQID